MDLSINGHCKVPPGFRFHPTEEELLQYYLEKKVAEEMIDLDVIPCVDLNKLEPWDIQERCRIGSRPQNEWYFFSRKDKKYPSGTRTNRATDVGFWKATGRDKIVYNNSKQIGLRKTLVFYLGRAPSGKKSDWIMYEYRLMDNTDDVNHVYNFGELKREDWWVICRLFKKRNFMAKENPQSSSTSSTITNDHTKTYITDKIKHKKQETNNLNTITSNNNAKIQSSINVSSTVDDGHHFEVCGNTNDDTFKGFCYSNSNNQCIYRENESIEDLSFSQIVQDMQMTYLFPSSPYQVSEAYSSDMDLWSFT